MALNRYRWAAIAAIGMLVVLAYGLSEPRPRQRTAAELEARRLAISKEFAESRAATFAAQERVARVADSVRATLRAPASAPLRVVYGAGVPANLRGPIDTIVAAAYAAVGAARVGIDVAVVSDTGQAAFQRSRPPGGLRLAQLLPSAPGERCVTVVMLGRNSGLWTAREMAADATKEQILGACRYYAAFGLPGAAVHRWMRESGVWFAYGGSWTRFSGVIETPRWFQDRQEFFGARNAALMFLSTPGLQCMMGDFAVCDSIVTKTPPPDRVVRTGAAVAANRYVGPWSSWSGWHLGGREEELLAGMVRLLGRDQFQAFWTSADPVPVAFERATGTPLGSWVSSWIAEQYGPVEHGPTTSFLSLLGAIAVVTGGLGFTLWTARRREYA
jgi:hypothetical protein